MDRIGRFSSYDDAGGRRAGAWFLFKNDRSRWFDSGVGTVFESREIGWTVRLEVEDRSLQSRLPIYLLFVALPNIPCGSPSIPYNCILQNQDCKRKHALSQYRPLHILRLQLLHHNLFLRRTTAHRPTILQPALHPHHHIQQPSFLPLLLGLALRQLRDVDTTDTGIQPVPKEAETESGDLGKAGRGNGAAEEQF